MGFLRSVYKTGKQALPYVLAGAAAFGAYKYVENQGLEKARTTSELKRLTDENEVLSREYESMRREKTSDSKIREIEEKQGNGETQKKGELREKLDFAEKIQWLPELNYRIGSVLTEEEGIKRMRFLAMTERWGGSCWLQLPEADAWIYCGRAIDLDEGMNESLIKNVGLKPHKGQLRLQATSDEGTIMHIIVKNIRGKKLISKAVKWVVHPLADDEQRAEHEVLEFVGKKGDKGATEEEMGKERKRQKFLNSITTCLPSRNEIPLWIAYMTSIYGQFRNFKGIEYRQGIRSAYGSTIVYLMPEGPEYFTGLWSKNPLKPEKGLGEYTDGLWEAADIDRIEIPVDLLDKQLDDPRVNRFRVETVRKFCEKMSTKKLRMEFIPDD